MRFGSSRVSRLIRRTPLHPQWLLGPRRVPPELAAHQGLVVDVGAADRWLASRLNPGARYLSLDFPGPDGSPYGSAPDAYASAEALPFADNSVDAIACFEVLEHLQRPDQALAEAHRVLRPGGLYVASAPFLYPLHDQPRDFRRYTPHGLSMVLSKTGFEVIGVRPMLGAIETAGLLAALAVAGGAMASRARWFLAPSAAALVLFINVGAWLLARAWPDWEGMAMGYEAVGRKR